MSPRSQGASQGIEDAAAALGIIFSDKYDFTRNIAAGLELHQKVRASERKPICECLSRKFLILFQTGSFCFSQRVQHARPCRRGGVQAWNPEWYPTIAPIPSFEE
jgi:hypothetical protein